MSVYLLLACVSIGALTLYLHHRLNQRRQRHNTIMSTHEYQQNLAEVLRFRKEKQALQKRLNHMISDDDARRLLALEQAWNTSFHTMTLSSLPEEEPPTISSSDDEMKQREETLLHPSLDAHQMTFLRHLIRSNKVNEFPEEFPKN